MYPLLILCILMNDINAGESSTAIRSLCPNNVTSKWNKQNIASNLREWIKSIRPEKPTNSTGEVCNMLTLAKYKLHSNVHPEKFSPYMVVIGKSPRCGNYNGKYDEKFIGPVWADINSQYEWLINRKTKRISQVSEEAAFHNGLYYGVINRDPLDIGKNCVNTIKG